MAGEYVVAPIVPSGIATPAMSSSQYIVTSIVSGGIGALAFDGVLHPVETVKTRLQSDTGFLKSGGFRGVYRGVASALLGSVPYGAAFFLAYDASKLCLSKRISNDTAVHMFGACIGETVASTVHMPFEVVKNTAQGPGNFNSLSAFKHVCKSGIHGLYCGLFSRVCREIPFVFLEFPIWEFLKVKVANHYKRDVTALESGICGSVAAAIAAAVTTPLDVAKTRIILSDKNSPSYTENPFRIMYQVYRDEGARKLFSGTIPRVVWLSLGAFLYLGAYDFSKIAICQNYIYLHS